MDRGVLAGGQGRTRSRLLRLLGVTRKVEATGARLRPFPPARRVCDTVASETPSTTEPARQSLLASPCSTHAPVVVGAWPVCRVVPAHPPSPAAELAAPPACTCFLRARLGLCRWGGVRRVGVCGLLRGRLHLEDARPGSARGHASPDRRRVQRAAAYPIRHACAP